MKELQILSADGKSRIVPLEGPGLTIGRSSASTLSFPDDNGLSRQHLSIERTGDIWFVRDLGSKNGTVLNGVKVTEPAPLKSGDRITAGHLIITCDAASVQSTRPLVFFDPMEGDEAQTSSATVITTLDGLMRQSEKAAQAKAGAAQNSALITALIRAGNELASYRPLPELFEFILDLAIEAVNANRGVLLTIESTGLEARANRGEGFHISGAVRDRVLNSGASVLVRDTSIDEALRERRSIVEQHIRTLMAVPLQTRDQVIGIIYVDSPSLLREFTEDDLKVLTVMANVAAIRIEQTRFAELEQARRLLARDLDQAAEIQRSFLPGVAPKVRGLDLAGHNAPCRTVGGDYYDFFRYGESRVALVLGDVSGKGMPASLLMMGLQARVQVLIEEPQDLAAVVTRLNRITAANCPSNRFITYFSCIVDGDTGDVVYCNAGHNPPLIVRGSGAVEELPGGGPVLGILKSVAYDEYRAHLEVGDTLVVYSDGVTEAASVAGEEFETERLGEAVARVRTESAAAILAAVNRAVADFTVGAPQSDDITLIIAKRV